MDQDTINRQEWQRPENWRGPLGMYRSSRDTRLWVPKRMSWMGWTINMAHSQAWFTLVGLFSVPIGLLLLFVLVQVFGPDR